MKSHSAVKLPGASKIGQAKHTRQNKISPTAYANGFYESESMHNSSMVTESRSQQNKVGGAYKATPKITPTEYASGFKESESRHSFSGRIKESKIRRSQCHITKKTAAKSTRAR